MSTATIITTSTGGIALDYSPFLERIASALETIVQVSTTTGIRVMNPYDYIQGIDSFNWYVKLGNTLTTTTTTSTAFSNYIDAIDSLSKQLPKFK